MAEAPRRLDAQQWAMYDLAARAHAAMKHAPSGQVQSYERDRTTPSGIVIHEKVRAYARKNVPGNGLPPLPHMPPLRAQAELRNLAPRPGTSESEVLASQLGRDLASGSYGNAAADAVELAVAIGIGARGRRGKKPTGAAGSATGAGAEAGKLPDRGGLPGGEQRLPAPGGPLNPYVAIPGQPAVAKIPGHGEVEVRPIPKIEAAARDYAQSRGRPYETAASFQPLDVERSKRIAVAYDAMKHDPHNALVQAAYAAMIDETLGQYQTLKRQGYEFKFNQAGQDPYKASPALGYLDMRDNGRLFVFPTIEGHGSKGAVLTKAEVANNPLLQDSGEKFGNKPALVNDVFRAVHDAYGHNGPGNPFFRGPGEDRAFGHHQILYGPAAWPAIASELRGQNSWLNYGPHAEHNKGKSAIDTIYAEQKVGVMPSWVWLEGLPERKKHK